MTRKRYMKLLMSHGVQRNEAEIHATIVQVKGLSYKQDYATKEPFLRVIHAMKRIGQVIQDFGTAAAEAAKSLRKLCNGYRLSE